MEEGEAVEGMQEVAGGGHIYSAARCAEVYVGVNKKESVGATATHRQRGESRMEEMMVVEDCESDMEDDDGAREMASMKNVMLISSEISKPVITARPRVATAATAAAAAAATEGGARTMDTTRAFEARRLDVSGVRVTSKELQKRVDEDFMSGRRGWMRSIGEDAGRSEETSIRAARNDDNNTLFSLRERDLNAAPTTSLPSRTQRRGGSSKAAVPEKHDTYHRSKVRRTKKAAPLEEESRREREHDRLEQLAHVRREAAAKARAAAVAAASAREEKRRLHLQRLEEENARIAATDNSDPSIADNPSQRDDNDTSEAVVAEAAKAASGGSCSHETMDKAIINAKPKPPLRPRLFLRQREEAEAARLEEEERTRARRAQLEDLQYRLRQAELRRARVQKRRQREAIATAEKKALEDAEHKAAEDEEKRKALLSSPAGRAFVPKKRSPASSKKKTTTQKSISVPQDSFSSNVKEEEAASSSDVPVAQRDDAKDHDAVASRTGVDEGETTDKALEADGQGESMPASSETKADIAEQIRALLHERDSGHDKTRVDRGAHAEALPVSVTYDGSVNDDVANASTEKSTKKVEDKPWRCGMRKLKPKGKINLSHIDEDRQRDDKLGFCIAVDEQEEKKRKEVRHWMQSRRAHQRKASETERRRAEEERRRMISANKAAAERSVRWARTRAKQQSANPQPEIRVRPAWVGVFDNDDDDDDDDGGDHHDEDETDVHEAGNDHDEASDVLASVTVNGRAAVGTLGDSQMSVDPSIVSIPTRRDETQLAYEVDIDHDDDEPPPLPSSLPSSSARELDFGDMPSRSGHETYVSVHVDGVHVNTHSLHSAVSSEQDTLHSMTPKRRHKKSGAGVAFSMRSKRKTLLRQKASGAVVPKSAALGRRQRQDARGDVSMDRLRSLMQRVTAKLDVLEKEAALASPSSTTSRDTSRDIISEDNDNDQPAAVPSTRHVGDGEDVQRLEDEVEHDSMLLDNENLGSHFRDGTSTVVEFDSTSPHVAAPSHDGHCHAVSVSALDASTVSATPDDDEAMTSDDPRIVDHEDEDDNADIASATSSSVDEEIDVEEDEENNDNLIASDKLIDLNNFVDDSISSSFLDNDPNDTLHDVDEEDDESALPSSSPMSASEKRKHHNRIVDDSDGLTLMKVYAMKRQKQQDIQLQGEEEVTAISTEGLLGDAATNGHEALHMPVSTASPPRRPQPASDDDAGDTTKASSSRAMYRDASTMHYSEDLEDIDFEEGSSIIIAKQKAEHESKLDAKPDDTISFGVGVDTSDLTAPSTQFTATLMNANQAPWSAAPETAAQQSTRGPVSEEEDRPAFTSTNMTTREAGTHADHDADETKRRSAALLEADFKTELARLEAVDSIGAELQRAEHERALNAALGKQQELARMIDGARYREEVREEGMGAVNKMAETFATEMRKMSASVIEVRVLSQMHTILLSAALNLDTHVCVCVCVFVFEHDFLLLFKLLCCTSAVVRAH